MKSLTKILLLTLAIIISLVIFIFYFFTIGIPNAVTNDIEHRSCSGVIVSIESTQPCFINIEVKQRDTVITLDAGKCCGSKFDSFFRFAEIGDSVIKEKGKLTISIVKAKTHERKEFDYPYCLK